MNEPRIVMTEEQWQRERQRIRMYVYILGGAIASAFVVVMNVVVAHT